MSVKFAGMTRLGFACLAHPDLAHRRPRLHLQRWSRCGVLDERGGGQERYHPVDDPTAPGGFIGFTHRDPDSGWITDWNMRLLSSAPSYVHDFVFFHECAHAKNGDPRRGESQLPRAARHACSGRAGKDIEAKLAAYHNRLRPMGPPYGKGSEFSRPGRCPVRTMQRRNQEIHGIRFAAHFPVRCGPSPPASQARRWLQEFERRLQSRPRDAIKEGSRPMSRRRFDATCRAAGKRVESAMNLTGSRDASSGGRGLVSELIVWPS